MKSVITKIFKKIKGKTHEVFLNEKYKTEEEKIRDSIKMAQEEWKAKEKYFDHATDPDLVDFAIYDIEASKRKYTYLLKKLKKENNM